MQISSAGITVDGAKVDGEAGLKAALVQADAAAVDVQAEADAPSPLVLAALTLGAGPKVSWRHLSWQKLRLEISDLHDPRPVSVFSWRADRTTQLWSISVGPSLAKLGPYEPGDESVEAAVISKLAKACVPSGCSLDVELREERLAADLQAWQRIGAAVGSPLELRVGRPWPPLPDPQRPELGYLPPAVIQAVVRAGFHHFRDCYEAGLGKDPNLEGRVSVSFVIERDGTVKNATDHGADMPDAAVRDCVIRHFVDFKFPAPETGVVTVVYPIMFAPG